jgi:hypothetical protein
MELKDIGYRQATTVDWAGLTDKIAKGISNIGVAKAKSDEETNKIYDATFKKLNEPTSLSNNTLTSFVLDGSKAYKDYALALHNKWKAREITSNDVKKRLSNAQENWVDFANQTKDVDARYKIFMDRAVPGANGRSEGSDAEDFLISEWGKMSDLKNKKPVVGEDGFMYMQSPDGSIMNFGTLSKPENVQIDNVDLAAAVDGLTSDWAEADVYTQFGRGGEMTTTSVKNQGKNGDDYKLMKINAVNALVSNPKTALSILVDNGAINGAIYYSDDADGKDKLQKKIIETKANYEAVGKEFTAEDQKKIENSLIKFVLDENDIWTPALTEDQMILAKNRAGQEIDISLETKINASAPPVYAPNYGGGDANGGGGDAAPAANPLSSTYAIIVNAWGKPNGSDILTNLSGGQFIFELAEGGGYNVKDKDGKLLSTIPNDNIRSGAPYLGFGSGTGAKGTTGALAEYDRQMIEFNNAKNSGGSKPAAKKEIKASDVPAAAKAAGYTEAEYRKQLKANGIKII